MRRAALFGILAVLSLQIAGVGTALADPPGPPPPPECKYCQGPPPPPTPVPTVAPTQLAPQVTVDVRLAPTHVSRGDAAKIAVTAQQAAKVTIAVRYKGTKTSHTVHSTVGSSGMLVKLWRVPKTAPLGTAKITVSISTESHPFSLQLTVTK